MTKDAASNFSFIEPMKALPVRDLPSGDCLYEMKFDGYRGPCLQGRYMSALKGALSVFIEDPEHFGNDGEQLINLSRV